MLSLGGEGIKVQSLKTHFPVRWHMPSAVAMTHNRCHPIHTPGTAVPSTSVPAVHVPAVTARHKQQHTEYFFLCTSFFLSLEMHLEEGSLVQKDPSFSQCLYGPLWRDMVSTSLDKTAWLALGPYEQDKTAMPVRSAHLQNSQSCTLTLQSN